MVFDLFNAQVMLYKKEQQRQADLMLDRVKDIPTRLAAKQASFVNINARQPPLEQLASQMSSLQSGIVYKNQYQGQYNRKLYQGQRE